MTKNIKYLFLFISLITNSVFIEAQVKVSNNNQILCEETNSAEKKVGEKYYNKLYFKHFSILLRDTCTSNNRFTNCYIYNDLNCLQEYYFKPFYIDSQFVKLTEEFLVSSGAMQNVTNIEMTAKKFKTKLNQYVRIYGGFVDNFEVKYVVVQFVTKREFENNSLFNYQFDLFAIRSTSKLRFIIFRIDGALVKVYKSFI